MRNDNCPNCRLKCSVCKYPDCIYDGDYVSLTEQRAAARQDKRALWYRLSWAEIYRLETKNKPGKKPKKKKEFRLVSVR